MKKLLVALALLSSTSFAQDEKLEAPISIIENSDGIENVEFIPNGVITSIKASPANGGINPSFAGVKLEGTIKAGGNSCEAQRFEVGIEMVKKAGKIIFTPFVREKEGSGDFMCIAIYDENFAGLPFNQTFVENRKKLEKALVKDVEAQGTLVTLSSLYNEELSNNPVTEPSTPSAPAQCSNIGRFCMKNFDPHTCEQAVTKADGSEEILTSRGNNECEARMNLEVSLCRKKSAIDENKIVCRPAGEVM